MRPASGLLSPTVFSSCLLLMTALESAIGRNSAIHMLHKRIIKGTTVKPPFKDPFMTALFVTPDGGGPPSFNCGGILLNEEWVLTAGQCSFTESAGNGGPKDWPRTFVETGRFDLRKNVTQERKGRYGVGFQATYPDFLDILGPLYDDIALWRLKGRAVGAAKVGLAISDELAKAGTIATMTGWGRLRDVSRQSNLLAEAEMRILSNKDCKKKLPDVEEGPVFNGTYQICAVGVMNEIGISAGDAGGPLFVYVGKGRERVPVLIGIASRAVEKNGVRYSIFTRVSRYVQWIADTVEKQSLRAC